MNAFLNALAPTLTLAGLYCVLLSLCSRENALVRRFIVTMLQLTLIRYVGFRVYSVYRGYEATLAWWVCALFLFVEFVSLLLTYRSLNALKHAPLPNKRVDAAQRWWLDGDAAPMIDVLIPTYNEDHRILLRTLVGARGLDYPRFRVWLLDDGRRPWLQEMAAEHGVGYLTRDSNAGFKAGNLNNGLAHLRLLPEPPSFIAVFDADFIPRPSFLTRTLALMKDVKVALVQTPQHFYNADPFQYVLRAERAWPDDQRNWFDSRLPSLDAMGSATCCGTSCLIRTEALKTVGDFPTESVSEDTLLSIKLKRAGFRTVYLNEPLSVGLAPESLSEFIKQRARWCLGGLQIAQNRQWGPRSKPKRIAAFFLFLEAFLKWGWHGGMKVMWMTILPLHLLFGFTLLRANLIEFISYIAPVFVARAGMAWLNRGTFMFIVSDAPALVMAPYVVGTTWRVALGRAAHEFKVTDKGTNRQSFVFLARPAAVPLTLLMLTVVSLVYAALTPHSVLNSTRIGTPILFWAAINLIILVAALAPCLEPPKYRKSERYSCSLETNVDLAGRFWSARVIDISESGCQVEGLTLERGEALRVYLPDFGWARGTVVRTMPGKRQGIRFELNHVEEMQMIRYVYCSESFIQPVLQWSFFRAIGSVFRYMARA